MKLLLSVLLVVALVYSGYAQTKQWKDSDTVSVEVTSKDGKNIYRMVEVDYKKVQLQLHEKVINFQEAPQQYLAKYKTDLTYIEGGGEGEGRKCSIAVSVYSLNDLSKVVFETKQECDALEFGSGYYKTIKLGCCSAPATVTFYDYKHGKIIEGTNRVKEIKAPYSPMRFFVSFTDTPNDSVKVGDITIAYGSDDKYFLRLLTSPSVKDKVRNQNIVCPFLSPEILVQTTKKYDTSFNTEEYYVLDFLRGAESKSDLNDFSLKLTIGCGYSKAPIVIPIINGLPFGKSEREQIISIK